MKTLFGFGTVMTLAMAAVACGTPEAPASSSSSLEVTGTVDTRLRTLDNASAVAIGSDGRTFSAYVKKNGSFKLNLPVGHVYRILIANSTMAGQLRTVGHLVNSTSSGRSDEIAVKQGGKMNLGALRPAGTSPSAVKTACDCDEGGYGDKGEPADEGGYGDKGEPADEKGDVSEKGDDDYKSKPKDDDKDRICEDEADVELEAENGPGDKCKKSADDKAAPKPTKKSCSTKDADKDGKDDGEQSDKCGGVGAKCGGGGGEKPESDTGEAGGYGDKPEADQTEDKSPDSNGSCSCSLQCGKGSSCYASKCVADDAPSSKK